MSKIKEIFGKDSGITISDIEDIIESDSLNENDEIELTDADRFITAEKKEINKKKKQIKKIVSELVSFLNSGRGEGLLILGLAEQDHEIKIKGVKTFKNKEQIRSSVYNKIGTIPSNIKTFKMDIIPVKFNNGNIFLIEVGSNDLDCIYYSKLDNNVYVRQGDEAKSLSLPDFLELLANKNHARIFINFVEKPNNDNDSHIFEIRITNEGLEPGRNVTTILEILTGDGLKYTVTGDGIRKQGDKVFKIEGDNVFKDGSVIIKDFAKSNINNHGSSLFLDEISISKFTNNSGTPPNSLLIYPGFNGIIGTISIEKKDFIMFISVDNYEDRSHTQQTILIHSENDKVTIEEKEEDKKFNPYLKL